MLPVGLVHGFAGRRQLPLATTEAVPTFYQIPLGADDCSFKLHLLSFYGSIQCMLGAGPSARLQAYHSYNPISAPKSWNLWPQASSQASSRSVLVRRVLISALKVSRPRRQCVTRGGVWRWEKIERSGLSLPGKLSCNNVGFREHSNLWLRLQESNRRLTEEPAATDLARNERFFFPVISVACFSLWRRNYGKKRYRPSSSAIWVNHWSMETSLTNTHFAWVIMILYQQ